MFAKSNQMKKIRADYQRKRWEVATTTHDLGESGPAEIKEFDLDEGWTDGLDVPTGKDHPDTYREDRAVGDRTTVDIRTLKNR